MGEYNIAGQLHRFCMRLLETYRDCLDVHVIPAVLTHIANSLYILGPIEAATFASRFLDVAEDVLVANNAIHTEVSTYFQEKRG